MLGDITAYGPSNVTDITYKKIPVPLTIEHIKNIVSDFAKAVARAKESDFDGVQLNAAHGYLLSKFLMHYYNRLTDQIWRPDRKQGTDYI